MLIGFLAGIVCYFIVAKVKQKQGYDDSLDAFEVHGCGGTLSALLTGVFATVEVNQGFKAQAIVGTLIVLKVSDEIIGFRVTESQEVAGLDASLHGEEGYILEA